ncbi:hypothetical protein [Pseudoroseicyclus aestuarii]|uniref:Uncharacterized protein n=1 Tax=Pseudoroseicyclus aestuarii TaxID=1795041 RepID=A0A318SS71_9RHOB|nr:hypothetical protein [Pseudoroseicyclus aestuarii]PYE80586.1 hypothetical protein DFP88_1148 [Pseudoroseicyclus aestuarii]
MTIRIPFVLGVRQWPESEQGIIDRLTRHQKRLESPDNVLPAYLLKFGQQDDDQDFDV